MHELAFAQQILEAVESAAADYPDARVTRVKLKADEYMAIEPASLRFALESIAHDTVMAGAEVEIEEMSSASEDGERPWSGAGLVVEEIELDE